MGEEAETDEGGGEAKDGQDQSGVAVVALRRLPERHDPVPGLLDDQTNAPQALAGVRAGDWDAA